MIGNLSSYFSHAPSRAVGLVFAINSFMFGNWAARIPDVKDRLQLSEAQLGIALLGLSIGAMISMPFMGWLLSKRGAGQLSYLFVILYCLCMVPPVMADSLFWLTFFLVLVGLTNGATDIAMNAAAAAVEKKYKVSIMSTSHGMWSMGSMIGAGIAGFIAQKEVHHPTHMIVAAGLMLALSVLLTATLSKIKDDHEAGKAFVLPKGPILGLALITFCILIAEGAIADWSAVFIKNAALGNKMEASLGYAGFSLAMTLGRFYGDSVIPKYGKNKILKVCGVIATLGLALAVVISSPLPAILGFTIAGFGFSLMIPVLFSAAATVKGIAPGTGIAMVATLGYVGFLIGPPVIGFIAEEANLNYGLGFIVLMTFIAVLLSAFTKTK